MNAAPRIPADILASLTQSKVLQPRWKAHRCEPADDVEDGVRSPHHLATSLAPARPAAPGTPAPGGCPASPERDVRSLSQPRRALAQLGRRPRPAGCLHHAVARTASPRPGAAPTGRGARQAGPSSAAWRPRKLWAGGRPGIGVEAGRRWSRRQGERKTGGAGDKELFFYTAPYRQPAAPTPGRHSAVGKTVRLTFKWTGAVSSCQHSTFI